MQVIAGPVLFGAGLLLIQLAVHGMPLGAPGGRRGFTFRASPLRLFRRPGPSPFPATDDQMITDMLSEMLKLREELETLQSEVAGLREVASAPRARRTRTAG